MFVENIEYSTNKVGRSDKASDFTNVGIKNQSSVNSGPSMTLPKQV